MRLKDIDVNKTYGGMEIEVDIDFDKHKIEEVEENGEEKEIIVSSVETVKCILTAPRAMNIVNVQTCMSSEDDSENVDLEGVINAGLSWVRFKDKRSDINKKNIRMGECNDFCELITEFLRKATPSEEISKEG